MGMLFIRCLSAEEPIDPRRAEKQSPRFLYNKTNQMHLFPKFNPAWNSTCFGQFHCPSSGVYSLYIRHWYMSYRFEDSFRAGPGWNSVPSWSCSRVPSWSCSRAVYKPLWHIPVPNVQWINSWWWAVKLAETCRVSCRIKFGKLVHLVGFIIKKFVTMHGHVNAKNKVTEIWRQTVKR